MADNFAEKRGYAKGTYESLLTGEGYNLNDIASQYNYGANINPGEYNHIISNFQSPYQQKLTELGSDKFAWDPNQYLPEIQQTAESIYGPQRAQLEALRQVASATAVNTRMQTMDDFNSRMRQEVESINRRGAYFSGGAIQNEQNIRTEQARTLALQAMSAMAADFGNLAQQAGLSASQAEYIKDALFNQESSAYNRWKDSRNFSFDLLQAGHTASTNAAQSAISASQWGATFNKKSE